MRFANLPKNSNYLIDMCRLAMRMYNLSKTATI
jgi:hypothetical protein